MRGLRTGVLLVLGAALLWLFGFGGMSDIGQWAAAQQRETQATLAAGLRAVRAGEPGAWFALMGICAAYGFFHAAGPGHGKLVIGGYGAAEQVTAWRLSWLAVASSLAQALTAVLLVTIGAWALGWGRTELTDAAEKVLAPASYIAIALLGLWLMVRGLRRARDVAVHQVDETGHCSSCGHAHGPSVDEAASMSSWARCHRDHWICRHAALYRRCVPVDPLLWSGHPMGGRRRCACYGAGHGQRDGSGGHGRGKRPAIRVCGLVRRQQRPRHGTDRDGGRGADRRPRRDNAGLAVALEGSGGIP